LDPPAYGSGASECHLVDRHEGFTVLLLGVWYLVDLHVLGDGGAGGRAVAAEDVDDAGGKASFFDEFGDVEGGERRLLAGFEDGDAAGGEAGAELPSKHEKGEVPGDDLSAHANGFVEGHGEEVAVDGHCLALDLVSPASIVAQAADDQVKVGRSAVHLAISSVGLAVVQRLHLSQIRAVALDEVSQLVDQVAAAGGVHGAPGGADGEGGAGSFDCKVDVCFIRLLHLADYLLGCGVDGGEGLAADGVDEFAVDEEAGLEFGNVDVVRHGGFAGQCMLFTAAIL